MGWARFSSVVWAVVPGFGRGRWLVQRWYSGGAVMVIPGWLSQYMTRMIAARGKRVEALERLRWRWFCLRASSHYPTATTLRLFVLGIALLLWNIFDWYWYRMGLASLSLERCGAVFLVIIPWFSRIGRVQMWMTHRYEEETCWKRAQIEITTAGVFATLENTMGFSYTSPC